MSSKFSSLGTILIIVGLFLVYLVPANAGPNDVYFVDSQHGFELTSMGNWCELDGVDDYAEAADSTSLDIGDESNEDLTIEAWVYPRKFPDVGDSRLIAGKKNAYGLYLTKEQVPIPEPPYFKILPGFMFCLVSSDGPSTCYIVWANYKIEVWYHIAGVFDNFTNTTAFYVNGAKTGPSTFTYNINNSLEPFKVGGPSFDEYFDGLIDEIRVSDVTRYSDDFSPPLEPFIPDANTRALWHFDEPICSTLFFDSSGNNNTLTGVNGAHIGGEFVVGDVSGNGNVTAYDASLVLQHIVGLITLSPEQQQAADVTNNNTISALDAALILQYCVGLITEFPREQPCIAPALDPKATELSKHQVPY